MDLVAVRCAKCDSRLGNLANSWTRIGKKYITPVTHAEEKGDVDKISATGAVRIGDAGTLVEGWYGFYSSFSNIITFAYSPFFVDCNC